MKLVLDVDRLAELRQRAGMSQNDLAKASGVSQTYLAELERGAKSNPGPGVVRRLADALDVDVDAIAGWE